MPQALAFQAVLVPFSPLTAKPENPVVRTIAIREDQTLEQPTRPCGSPSAGPNLTSTRSG